MILAGFWLSGLSAWADLIALNTENTGQSATTSGGQTTDNNWKYTNFYNVYNVSTTAYDPGTTGQAVIAYTPYPSAWVQDAVSPAGFWVGPAKNQSDTTNAGGNAPGIYAYQISFYSSVARTVKVSGLMAADNDYEIASSSSATVVGAKIAVAAPGGSAVGQLVGSGNSYGFNTTTTTQQYGSTTAFSFNLTVTAGSTTYLDFIVLNQDTGYNNPTGLDVTDFSVAAVPEPPTWAIVLAGLGLVALGRAQLRRRQGELAGAVETKPPRRVS